MFHAKAPFYIFNIIQVLFFEILAVVCAAYLPSNLGFWMAVLCLATSQIQSGWSQVYTIRFLQRLKIYSMTTDTSLCSIRFVPLSFVVPAQKS